MSRSHRPPRPGPRGARPRRPGQGRNAWLRSWLLLYDDGFHETLAVELGLASGKPQPAAREPARGSRQDDVLAAMHALDERLERLARPHRQPVLNHAGTRVELLRHEVDRRSVLAIPGLEDAPVRVEPAMPRQQRGVDVQHSTLEALNEA